MDASEAPQAAAAEQLEPILLHANAPWVGTGYGTQAALFGPRIADLGYRLAFSAFHGLHGSALGWVAKNGRPFKVYPGHRDTHGSDVVGAHYMDWCKGEKGLLLTLTDPWVLAPAVISQLPTVSWIPVDHDPLMPRTHAWVERTGAVPVAMSKFGVRVFEQAGISALYAPHGFDSDIFMPGDRAAAREIFDIPQDRFVVGMVAANKGNPSRKSFGEALMAFAEFKKRYCSEAVLYMHTQLEAPGGVNLINLCETLNIFPASTDQYKNAVGQSEVHVAALMNCLDVLLNPSTGEGFGCTLVEANACGTPCITTNFSSMPEVAPVSEGNWTVDGQKVWTGFESWQVTPSVEALVDCLRDAYEEAEANRLKRRESVAAWALKEYEADHVTKTYWRPVLEDAKARIKFGNKRMRKVVSE